MTEELWADVDHYFERALIPPDPALEGALEDSAAAELPAIQVAPNQGKLLHLLARMMNARTVLEIGTLGGYSTIWLARALPPDGRLVTIEMDPHHATVARRNIERAGLARIVDQRVGAALQMLPPLARDPAHPFDLVFIDADKQHIPEYYEWALRLTRPGGMIIVDNVVRRGAVLDAASENDDIRGVRQFVERLGSDARVTATAIQTVGVKGYDGFVIARVAG